MRGPIAGAQPPAAHGTGWGVFQKLAGSRGDAPCGCFLGILEQLRFPQTYLGRRWAVSLPTILLKRLWGFFFFPFFPLPFPSQQPRSRKRFPFALCIYLKSDW